MSQENVESVRGVYAAWSRGDFRSTVDLYDRRVVFIDAVTAPVDAEYFVGPEGVRDYMRNFLSVWSRVTIQAEEIREAGDSVVVSTLQLTVGRSGGVPVEFRYFHVWSFRGPKVIRLEVFRERSEALEAVGLSE